MTKLRKQRHTERKGEREREMYITDSSQSFDHWLKISNLYKLRGQYQTTDYTSENLLSMIIRYNYLFLWRFHYVIMRITFIMIDKFNVKRIEVRNVSLYIVKA